MAQSKEIPATPSMDLGAGFNDLTGESLDSVFEYSTINPTKGKADVGQSGTFFMKRVDTTESLMENLNISVEASGRFGLFGADAQMNFVEKSNFNSQSTFFVAKVEISKTMTKFYDAKIKDVALNLAKKGDSKKFKKLFGDFFISGITSGGEFYGIVEIIASSKEDERKIAAALEASYGTPISGVDLKVSVSHEEIEKMTKREIRVYITQVGGVEEGMVFETDVDKMIDKARNFSLALQGNKGANYRANLRSYDSLADLPEPNLEYVQAKEDALNDCARKRLKYMTLLNDLEFYDNNADIYEPTTVIPDEKLTQWKNELTELRNLLTKHAIKVAGDNDVTDFFEEKINNVKVNLSEINLPKRRKTSSDATEITIPNFATMKLDDAIKEIAKQKLRLNVKYNLTAVKGATENLVKDTTPTAGEVVKPDTILTINYQGPPEKVSLRQLKHMTLAKVKR